MKAAMLVAFAAAQPLHQQGVPMPPPHSFQTTHEIRDAVITAYQRPTSGSGVLHIYVIFHVRGPEGATYLIHWTYFGAEQFLPPVGSVCRIRFHYEPGLTTAGFGDSRRDFAHPGLFADSISCDTGEAEGEAIDPFPTAPVENL